MLIAFHKPYGVLSQFNQNPDKPDQRTLAEFDFPKGLRPVGRLDMDSEGLLLLTDDASLENRLLDPKHGHRRQYTVQVDGEVSEASLETLRSGGVNIRGHLTKPCRVKKLSDAPKLHDRDPAVDPHAAARSCWIEIELTEGKNRQVRRMTAAVGHPTLRLVRTQIGDYALGDLPLAEWQALSEQDVHMLFR